MGYISDLVNQSNSFIRQTTIYQLMFLKSGKTFHQVNVFKSIISGTDRY